MSRSMTMQAFEAYVAKRVEMGDPPKVTQWSLLSPAVRAGWEAAMGVPHETVKQLREENARVEADQRVIQRLSAENDRYQRFKEQVAESEKPVPMLLWCPECGQRHIDEGEFAVKTHHTHACQHCGLCWRPAKVATVGVWFLPGFKNDSEPEKSC